MKRIVALLLVCFLVSGCGSGHRGMDQTLDFRQRLLSANCCTFDAEIIADYGEKLHEFAMFCSINGSGDMTFTVTKPKSIEGIQGLVLETGGRLTFDDEVLAFEPMIDGMVSPVIAPWLLVRSLRKGYISSVGYSGESISIIIDDTYNGENLRADIILNQVTLPVSGELYYNGKRILTVVVSNFQIL